VGCYVGEELIGGRNGRTEDEETQGVIVLRTVGSAVGLRYTEARRDDESEAGRRRGRMLLKEKVSTERSAGLLSDSNFPVMTRSQMRRERHGWRKILLDCRPQIAKTPYPGFCHGRTLWSRGDRLW
jgi:hypothetical protein